MKSKRNNVKITHSVHKESNGFYSLNEIKKINAHYNMIIGERSNGKTFACLTEAISIFVKHGHQTAYIRRWKEDFKGKRAQQLFDGVVQNGIVDELTNGIWNTIKHISGRWYLAKIDTELNDCVVDNEPFMFGFSLSDMEHDKSTSYPKVEMIIFDEFLSRNIYLQDEFVTFMNVLSTIIRQKNSVKIYMLANTVNKYSPYFKEMGLRHIQEMTQGTIDVYTYGNSPLKVAVEYCGESIRSKKKSDVYFAFDNPSLEMITGGVWELGIYPHCPCEYKKSNIIFTYFIIFDDYTLQCEIVLVDDSLFTYIHEKTTPIKDENKDLIFSDSWSPKPNHFRNIRKSSNKIVQKIGWFFKNDKVFYQDNDIGEIVRNYLQFCLKA